MKSLYLPILLVLTVAIGMAGSARAGGTVMVTNSTPYTLTAFYASPSDYSAWSTANNLITGTPLAPGQSTTVTITGWDCEYDLMGILYGAAQYAYQYEVNACGGGSWNITTGH